MRYQGLRTGAALLGSLCLAAALLIVAAGGGQARPASAAARMAITTTPEPPTTTPVVDTPAPGTPGPGTPAPGTPVPTAAPPGDEGDRADPRLEKGVSPATARPGDTVLFTLTVTNEGDDDADDVVVTDPLPAAFAVLGADADRGSVDVSGNTVVASLGSVKPGEAVAVRIRARVVSAGGENTASLKTSTRGNVVANDVASVTLGQPEATPTATAAPLPTPAATPAAVLSPQVSGPAGAASGGPRPASGAGASPRLPHTADGAAQSLLVLGALGLAALGAGLVLRRRPKA